MAKMSDFIIGIILVSTIMLILGVVTSEVMVKQDLTLNKSLSSYSKLQEISNLTNETQSGISDISEKSGSFDILGDFFSNGYKTLKIAWKSIDYFGEMINQFFTDIDWFGGYGGYLKTAIIAIIGIAIFVGIIMSTIVKREV